MKNNSSQISVMEGRQGGREGGRRQMETHPPSVTSGPTKSFLSRLVQFTQALPGRSALGPRKCSGARARLTYHCRDVDDPLHRLGFVDAAPQQALRIQAGLGIGVAEPGQQGGLARHAGQFGATRRRALDLRDRGGGAGGPSAAAAVTAAVTAAAAAPARVRARRPAPGGPVGEQESGREAL